MKALDEFKEFYLFTDFIDMRKDINALSFIAQEEMSADWSKPQLCVFIGKRKNLIKILYYDKSGFALWKKRLEFNRYPWLKTKAGSSTKSFDLKEVKHFLSSVDFFSKHEKKVYSLVG